MRALSIRQPYAELILRGIKTAEFRSRPTRIIGERFYLYASMTPATKIWSQDLAMPGDALLEWMLELAEQVGMIEPNALLPRGVIVGSAVISKCELVGSRTSASSVEPQSAVGSDGEQSLLPTGDCGLPTYYQWHLTGVRRAETLRKPKRHPQPAWFQPF